MADLEGKTIASTYRSILNVGTADNAELHATTLKIIEDGAGNDSSLYLAQQKVKIQPPSGTDSTTMFQILDADGGTPIFNIDSTNENVGIGTTTPNKSENTSTDTILTVGDGAAKGYEGIIELVGHGDDDAGGDVGLGAIQFIDMSNSATNHKITSMITGESWDGGSTPNEQGGKLEFWTKDEASTPPSAKMTILGDGKVGIGTGSPESILEVHGSSGSSGAIRVAGGEGATDAMIEFAEDDGDTGSMKWVNFLNAGSDHLYWAQVTNSDWTTGKDNEMRLSSSGVLDTEGAMNASQTIDYAEYFETFDGKAIAKGITVILVDGKIKPAQDGETPIGVIRPPATSAIVAGGQVFHWQGKYLRNDYGEVQYDERIYTYMETDSVTGKKDKPSGKTKKMYDRKINPDFDESKEYVEREFRDEWQIVGLLGQVPINKGQPVASSWIKMSEVSDSIDMYFIK